MLFLKIIITTLWSTTICTYLLTNISNICICSTTITKFGRCTEYVVNCVLISNLTIVNVWSVCVVNMPNIKNKYRGSVLTAWNMRRGIRYPDKYKNNNSIKEDSKCLNMLSAFSPVWLGPKFVQVNLLAHSVSWLFYHTISLLFIYYYYYQYSVVVAKYDSNVKI